MVIGFGYLPQCDDLMIDKRDVRSSKPFFSGEASQHDGEQDNSCPFCNLWFHLIVFCFFLNSCSITSDAPSEQVVPVVLGELL